MINDKQIQELIKIAKEYRLNAYAPYSKFQVGSAILTKNGKIYGGVNVENASYPVGICAERNALGTAISHGEREFLAIAIVADTPEPCSPCGMCRQMLVEFPVELVIMTNLQGDIKCLTPKDLLPHSFSL